MLRLHYAPGSVALASALALAEVGTPFEAVLVDFAAAAQTSPAYLALNPKGRVPLLETPEGLLTETGAILEYVAPALIPDAPFAQARMREVMYYLASTMHVAHAHKMRGKRWADQDASLADMRAKVPQSMTACCAYLEQNLPLAPFACGAQMTVADPYLYTIVRWAPGDGVDMSAYPKLRAFVAMMDARPAMQMLGARGIS